LHQSIESWEVSVVGAVSARELPYAFDMIEFRAIGRKEVESQVLAVLPQPGFEVGRMMIAGVVQDYQHLLAFPPTPDKVFEKRMEGGSVEFPLTSYCQPPVRRTNSAKDGDAFAGWRVQNNRVRIFGGYPHGAP
jgi:hypothetical protein